jgi:REP element-mobilizing transposase RayT
MNNHRKSIRLREYDYSQAGGYFVTIATHQRTCLFGEIREGTIFLSPLGKVVENVLTTLPGKFQGLELDETIIMPDHIHMIIIIGDGEGAVKPTLGQIVRAFKAAVSFRYKYMAGGDGGMLWQRNYYEHIIRDERDLNTCREYIANNIQAWVEKHIVD